MQLAFHKGQREVLQDKHRFKVVVAGRKWMKTTLMINWLFLQAIQNDLVYPYVAPFRQQAKEIAWDDHITRLLNSCERDKINYKKNESELSLTFPSGGKLVLLGVDNAEAHRGKSNWGAIACDEFADWELNIWPSIIRPNLIPHKAPGIIGGTPKGFDNLYEFYNAGLSDNPNRNPDFKSFHFTSYDNPCLDKEELKAMEIEYKEKGEDWYRQEIMAEFVKPYGTVYTDWPIENFREVNYDPGLPLHITMDFGVNDPMAIIWIQTNGSEFRAIDYYEASNANIEHFIQVIRSKPYEEAELYTGDPSGKARSITTGTSPIEIMAQKGIFVRTTDNVKIPDQIRATHRIIKSLYVSNRLERLRDCIFNYRYPTKKETVINQSNEIPLHDEYSHAMRALEYYAVNIRGFKPDQPRVRVYTGGDPITGFGKRPNVRTFGRRNAL
jgi:hypothetical protein